MPWAALVPLIGSAISGVTSAIGAAQAGDARKDAEAAFNQNAGGPVAPVDAAKLGNTGKAMGLTASPFAGNFGVRPAPGPSMAAGAPGAPAAVKTGATAAPVAPTGPIKLKGLGKSGI